MRNTMKKTMLIAVLLIVMMSLAFSAVALEKTGLCGENVTYAYDSSTQELTVSGSGAMENYYPYKKSPFYNSKIESVVIEEGVTSIGSYAFDGCSELETVTIADTVTAVNEKAFEGCYNISEVYAADAEAWLKIDFDYGYDADEECVCTSNPLSNGADLYFNGQLVTQVDIPVTITQIKPAAFYNCRSLKVVSIPEAVTSIGDGAFWNCSSLEGVVMSEGVTRIGEAAFYSCDSLESIWLTDSVTSIGYEAFGECDKLETVMLGGVQTIGRLAFRGCDKLREITITKSTKTISAEAFAGCMNIEKVYAADLDSWLKISFAPYSEGDLNNFSSNPLFYGADLYINGVLVTELEIPSGVTEIKAGTFCNCASIKKLVIPASVSVIGNGAFGGINCIDEVYFAGSDVQWKDVNIGSNNDTLVEATIRFASVALGKTSSITATQTVDSVTLAWKAVSGANVYAVYQKNGSGWKKLGEVAKLNGLIKNLKAGTKYTFAVKAGKKVDGAVEWAKDYTTISTATKSVAPSKVSATQSTSAIKLTWTASAGADGYRIFYKSEGKWKTTVSSTTALSHTFKSLKAGAKYTFAIQPYIKTSSGVVWGVYAEYVAATTPATPTVKVTAPSKGKVTVNWNAVNGAEGYQVYYKKGNGSYTLYKTYNKAGTLTFSNLKSGTKYTFAVRAVIKTSAGNVRSGYKEAAVTVK